MRGDSYLVFLEKNVSAFERSHAKHSLCVVNPVTTAVNSIKGKAALNFMNS